MKTKITKDQIGVLFLEYTGQEYNSIRKLVSQKYRHKIAFDEDVLHDTLIKVYDIIVRKGFKFTDNNINLSGQSFLNYIFQAYHTNNVKEQIEIKKKISSEVRIDCLNESNEDHPNDLVQADCSFDKFRNRESKLNLVQNDEEENDILEIRMLEDCTIESIMSWIEKNYTMIQYGFFKYYYMNLITYDEIAERTQYSKAFIFQNVKKVRMGVMKQFKNVVFVNRDKSTIKINKKR